MFFTNKVVIYLCQSVIKKIRGGIFAQIPVLCFGRGIYMNDNMESVQNVLRKLAKILNQVRFLILIYIWTKSQHLWMNI